VPKYTDQQARQQKAGRDADTPTLRPLDSSLCRLAEMTIEDLIEQAKVLEADERLEDALLKWREVVEPLRRIQVGK
jgi:hypothetical protein